LSMLLTSYAANHPWGRLVGAAPLVVAQVLMVDGHVVADRGSAQHTSISLAALGDWPAI
jgi:prepilin-type processing-associated H-X9-DG protein